MAFSLPDGLAPEVYPLAWLVGRWRGTGLVEYPGVGSRPVTGDLVVDHDGGPYLRWELTLREVVAPADAAALDEVADAGDDPVAEPGDPVWSTETGYWRVPPERPDGLPADRHPVEALLADPSGHVAVYVGMVGGGRVDLASDLLARTATGAEVTAATRMLGLVEGDLLWAWDLAAFGQPLQSYASGRLSRVER